MRTLRITAIVITMASLLALSTASAGTAQEGCTGVLEFDETGMTWSASDQRLSGDATSNGGWSLYDPASEDAGIPTGQQASYIIINDDGSWSCAESNPNGPEPDLTGHTLVFSGNGDYEGLTAHVRIDWSTYPFSFKGVIVESGLPEDPTLAG